MKKLAFFLIALVSLLFTIYTGIWIYHASLVQEEALSNLQKWQKEGLITHLEYEKLSTQGFPFAIELVFKNPKIGLKHSLSSDPVLISHQGLLRLGYSNWTSSYWFNLEGKTRLTSLENNQHQRYVFSLQPTTLLFQLPSNFSIYQLVLPPFLNLDRLEKWAEIQLKSTSLVTLYHEGDWQSRIAIERPSLQIKRDQLLNKMTFELVASDFGYQIDLRHERKPESSFEFALAKALMTQISRNMNNCLTVNGTLELSNSPSILGKLQGFLNSEIHFDYIEDGFDLVTHDEATLEIHPEGNHFVAHILYQGISKASKVYDQFAHETANELLNTLKHATATTEHQKAIQKALLDHPFAFNALFPKLRRFGEFKKNLDMNFMLTPKEKGIDIAVLLNHLELSTDLYGMKWHGMLQTAFPVNNSQVPSYGNLTFSLMNYKPLFIDFSHYANQWIKILNLIGLHDAPLPRISNAALKRTLDFFEGISDDHEAKGKDLVLTLVYSPQEFTIGKLPVHQILWKWNELHEQLQKDLNEQN